MHNDFLEKAIEEAKKAKNKQEVPVGAIIVKDGEIIARGHNSVEKTKNIMSHAEINVILKAAKKINNWRMNDCELYVTLEPCKMCREVIKRTRIKKVFYGIKNKEYELVENKYIESNNGKQKEKIKKLLELFFEAKR